MQGEALQMDRQPRPTELGHYRCLGEPSRGRCHQREKAASRRAGDLQQPFAEGQTATVVVTGLGYRQVHPFCVWAKIS